MLLYRLRWVAKPRARRALGIILPKGNGMATKKQTYKVTDTKNKNNKNGAKSAGGGKNGRSAPAKGSAAKGSPAKGTSAKGASPESRRVGFYHFMPLILIAAAVLLTISFFIKDFGVVGNFIRDYVFFGIFSVGAYIVPLFMILGAVLIFTERKTRHERSKLICTAVILIVTAALFHVFFAPAGTEKIINPIVHYNNGVLKQGGGFIGGLIGSLFVICFSKVGAAVILIVSFVILVMVVAGKTPKDIFESISQLNERRREKREERLAELEEERAELEAERELEERRDNRRKRGAVSDRQDGEAACEYFDGGDIPDVEEQTLQRAAKAERERRSAELDLTVADDDFPVEERQLEIPPEEEIPDVSERAEEPEIDGYDVESVADLRGDDMLDSEEDEPLFDDPGDEDLLRRLSETYLGRDNMPKTSLKVKVEDLSPTLEKGEVIDIPENTAEKTYVFPELSLLTEDKVRRITDSRRELENKEARLIQTLEKFNVHTESAGLPAKGPSITRYELRPTPGTRVRAIVNLVDDIALSLATSGIRIEAPIPGKSAVGIEVPNDERQIVRLRTLIDTPKFRDAKSKINVALGEDVAGEPVFFDIAKMPHLLIAGATGMGKSVCINCIIVSLLYKATPEEVKLILIDPKKVEFNMYSSLPHLLVPVVSDPKKAAGALSWAVNEMERRYGLIEEVGARNIFGYNDAVKGDSSRETLSQIVIIIDELADLMMTAPDSVEDSVCRLAQKARAAGMHLIIGTQRPSVDVITGTIKGNVPSRIACTVASQVDSRTIIDMVGAEKLIGQGDMLFSPVGAMKPIRVQGAFVSDSEVESVVSFIKDKNKDESGYSDDVMAQIESESVKCVSKKKSSVDIESAGESASEEDPMFWKAVELAVESGKISTSLIQRKCSLGFGRAAKLIDRMEELGFVTAPDGQKPRQVKITREELAEMKMGAAVPDADGEE